jgi:ferrochelatase
MGNKADREAGRSIGVLLLNLGGPDSLSAVRPFLYNLFSDRDIIRLGPSFLQKPIAWLISTFRSSKSRSMYSLIGGRSPILEITTAQAEALEKNLNRKMLAPGPLDKGEQAELFGKDGQAPIFKVYIGMRYWHPYIKDTVDRIHKDGIKDLIVLSLYPHYSKTTTGSSVIEFKKHIKGYGLNIKYIEQWYDHLLYIEALSELIYEGIEKFNNEDLTILYSAHSLPKSIIDEGDPYLDHINRTIEAVNRRLSEEPFNVKGMKWRLSFQSRSGPVEWLEPSTDDTIVRLGEEGVKNLFVVPISFVSDHIETLYEIGMLFRELAVKQGMKLRRCRSLNTSDKFIHALKELVLDTLKETR